MRVVLTKMVQKNKKTGWERRLRCCVADAESNSGKSNIFHYKIKASTGFKIKLLFFQGAELHLQKLLKDFVYRDQYIFGLPA